MKIIYNLTNYIEKMSKKDFDKNLKLVIGLIFFLAIGLSYFFYTQNSDLITRIKDTDKLKIKIQNIITKYDKIKIEEDRLKKLLDEDPNFNIRKFFEEFYTQQGITPEPNWDNEERLDFDKFEEIKISATFKNQTTQKLVSIIEELNKKGIVYLKGLKIENQGNSKITFYIDLATKKLKTV
jgi:regulator of replication initiation timing